MSDITFSGISSGMDTSGMIEKLMEVERRPIKSIEIKQTTINMKKQTFQEFSSLLKGLQGSAETLKDKNTFRQFQASMPGNDTISVNVDHNASPGTYTVEVDQLAKAEQLSSGVYASKSDALNITGELLINGQTISIKATDSLVEIRSLIDKADANVSTSIISVSDTDHRLVISSSKTGEIGINFSNGGSGDLLSTLGFSDGTTAIKHSTTDGAKSDKLSSSTTTIASQFSLSGTQSGNISIDGTNISIDLSTDSLTAISNSINNANIAGVSSTVEEVTDGSGSKAYQLVVSGSTTFTDDNNILQKIGLLEGGKSAVAQSLTSSVANSTGGANITASTDFSTIDGATATDGVSKILFSGTSHDGTSISGTYTYSNGDTVQDLLTQLETSFGLTSGAASIENGKLVVTDSTTGDSSLSINLAENSFGSLDFGAMEKTTVGRARELQSGQDAKFKINNISMTDSSNSVSGVLQGVTIKLKNTNANSNDAPIDVTVSRNNSSIKGSIEAFIEQHNAVRGAINQQFTYDSDLGRGGLLFGDSTLRTVQTQLQRTLSETIGGITSDVDRLIDVGISTDQAGLLSLDASKLDEVLNSDVNKVIDLFLGQGTPSDPDVTYIGMTDDTVAGTFNVNITTAAEQATLSGSGAVTGGAISVNETLSITDLSSNESATIGLTAGNTIDSIVSTINSVLSDKVAEIHTADLANTAAATAITANTTFAEIDGANVVDNDTITIGGTTHSGTTVSETYTITASNTIQDFMNSIQSAFGGGVTASIDGSGKLVVTDNSAGTSSLTVTLTENNEGGGSVDFGALTASTEGRNKLAVTASNDGGTLKLIHDSYGISNGFDVTSDVAIGGGGTEIGTTTLSDYGLNVAGTINGEAATGNGQTLTGNSGNANSDGLMLSIGISAADLLTQGSSQGTVNITHGFGVTIDRLMDKFLDSVDGLVATKVDNLGKEYDTMQKRIDKIEDRLVQVENRYKGVFLAMEKAMAKIQAQTSYLMSQLNALAKSGQSSDG